jgi:RNA polymerase sigma factor (sigma-70 family)
VAQHWSATHEDAQDAVQRALEIYMRRLDTLDPATELSWLRVVVKHEAMAIRSRHADHLPTEHLDHDERAAAEQRPVDDLLAGRERVRRSKEALSRLKPDEAKALVLKAQGLSYAEIGERLHWTYTKTNRCITEGRARFLKLYAELEAGEACERFAPTLASLAAGTADADAMLEIRPHLRNCPACRATVRDLHATRLGRLRVLWPIPALVAPLRWLGLGRGEPAPVPMPDDVLAPAPHLGPDDLHPVPGLGPDDLEPVDLWELYAAVERIDSATVHAAAESSGRWLELKSHLYAWFHRLSGTDVITATQISTGTGGGRIATLGAVLGFCLSGLGAGTVCVVTGVIELPPLSPPPKSAPATKKASKPASTPEPRKSPSREPKRPLAIAAAPTPPPQAEKQPARREPRREKRRERQPTATNADPAVAHETAEPLPVEETAPAEFAFEEPAPSQPQSTTPAAAPETGGGEFAP